MTNFHPNLPSLSPQHLVLTSDGLFHRQDKGPILVPVSILKSRRSTIHYSGSAFCALCQVRVAKAGSRALGEAATATQWAADRAALKLLQWGPVLPSSRNYVLVGQLYGPVAKLLDLKKQYLASVKVSNLFDVESYFSFQSLKTVAKIW